MTRTKSVHAEDQPITGRWDYVGSAIRQGLVHPFPLSPTMTERLRLRDLACSQQTEINYYSIFGGSTWNTEPLSRDQLWRVLSESERKFMTSMNEQFNIGFINANKQR